MASPDEYDILALQEPYIDNSSATRASKHYREHLPTVPRTDDTPKPRSIIMVNASLTTRDWTPLYVESPDVTAISLHNSGQPDTIIINAYVDCNNDESLTVTRELITDLQQMSPKPKIILLGDFNRHHPMWDSDNNQNLFTRRNMDAAQTLIDITSDFDLQMALPKGIPTILNSRGSETRPDNVFMTPQTHAALHSCRVIPELQPIIADHYPIITMLGMTIQRATFNPRPDFRKADWETLNATLAAELPPVTTPTTKDEFDAYLESTTQAIHSAVNSAVPKSNPSPHSKRWWTPELNQMRKALRGLARRSHKMKHLPNHPIHAVYRRERNAFQRHLEDAKNEGWSTFLRELDNNTVWTAHKVVSSEPTSGAKARVPTLTAQASDGTKRTYITDEQKAEILFNTFFGGTSGTSVPDTDETGQNTQPKATFEAITTDQVLRALENLNPAKATGPDEIPNAVLKACRHILVNHLTTLFNASISLKYMPTVWKDSRTVTSRKPNKSDYTKPNAFRPIEITANLRRLFGTIISEIISYQAEKYSLLPATQFGARPGRNPTDALHYIVHKVKDAWRRGQVVAMLCLDVKGAFTTVDTEILAREVRTAGFSEEIAEWFTRLKERHTELTFDDHSTAPRRVTSGVVQGVGDSGAGYIIYSSPLLRVPRSTAGESAVGFVDDVTYLAEGKTAQQANAKVRSMMTRSGGALEWARTHGAEFELSKCRHLLFSRKPSDHAAANTVTTPHITVNGIDVPTVRHHRVLGVIANDQLSFKEHGNRAVEIGNTWVSAYRRLTKGFQGVPPTYARRYYLAVAIPKMLYGASVYLQPPGGTTQGSAGLIKRLARVQRQAGLQITGAMKTTAYDVVDILADLPPFSYLVRNILYRETLRMATLPRSHPIHHLLRESLPANATHKPPLYILPRFFNIEPSTIETSPPFIQPPHWTPTWSTIIDSDQEVAIKRAKNIPTLLRAFTDGSAIKGEVGAAAGMYEGNKETAICKVHLGSVREHTVFEAELLGITAAVETHARSGSEQDITIGVDSQAAIRALERRGRGPATKIITTVQRIMQRLASRGSAITIQWVPGHMDIVENERVDRAAKAAAREGISNSECLPTVLGLIPNSAAAHQDIERKRVRDQIARSYLDSSRSNIIQIVNPIVPSRRFRRITKGLSRTQMVLLAQLITGHNALNLHLHRIGIKSSPACPSCGYHRETSFHFLIDCPAYEPLRAPLRRKLKRRASDFTTLVTNTKTYGLLFRYIQGTHRFPLHDWGRIT